MSDSKSSTDSASTNATDESGADEAGKPVAASQQDSADVREQKPGANGVSAATSVGRVKDRPATQQRTRIGAAWAAIAVAAVVLVVLLVFILQNLQQVQVQFFNVQARLPVGVLVLLSAAGGALLVLVLGAARMVQLRWLARRDRQAARKRRPT